MNNIPKSEHYIPQFYLKNFTKKRDKKSPTYVLDLKTNKIRGSSIRKIAFENNFCNIKTKDSNVIISIEEALSNIESKIAPSLEKLIYHLNPNILSGEERFQISSFFSLLLSRNPRQRELHKQITKEIKKKVGKKMTPEFEKKITSSENELKLLMFREIKMYLDEISPIFYKMNWSIGLGNFFARIHTSDNPLVRYNPRKVKFRSTLGLLCEGIQLILPLTPSICLFMYHAKDYPHQKILFNFNEENALFIKSALVGQANRWLFAQNKFDFDVRKGMKASNKLIEVL
jgi:hypothetical protein